LPLTERKAILQDLLPQSDIIKYCDHVEESGKAFFKEVLKANLEGMIAKRAGSRYLKGKRTTDWLKIKNINSDEAIIVGYTDPKGSRGYFGSLILASNKDGKLTYTSNVGTGFTQQSLQDLYAKLKPITRKQSPLDVPIKQTKDMHWVEPILVCNIKFTEITDDGSIRHPVFLGLRVDKAAKDVKPEKKISTPHTALKKNKQPSK
jgi:bifunctional non-homologous end joining protein LigD